MCLRTLKAGLEEQEKRESEEYICPNRGPDGWDIPHILGCDEDCFQCLEENMSFTMRAYSRMLSRKIPN